METIDKEKFEEKLNEIKLNGFGGSVKELTDDEIDYLVTTMNDPLRLMRELAVKIKLSLDNQMNLDMRNEGAYGPKTRAWTETYHKLLEGLQKALHGTKSVSLNLHKVSHSVIAAKIREADL